MLAIYKRDLKSYFVTMIGSIFIAFSVAVVGIYFSYYCLKNGYPYYGDVICSIAYMLMLALPILTMRSFAEEQKTKSDQILYTSGSSITSIVVGKYLAMVTVWLVPILICGLGPLVLSEFGTPSYKSDYAAILAVFLVGCAYIAVGMFISSLTESPILAAVITFGLLLLLQLMGGITSFISAKAFSSLVGLIIAVCLIALVYYLMSKNSFVAITIGFLGITVLIILYIMNQEKFNNFLPEFLNQIPLTDSLNNFSLKIFDIRALIYYLSVGFVFVFLTTQSIKKRRYS